MRRDRSSKKNLSAGAFGLTIVVLLALGGPAAAGEAEPIATESLSPTALSLAAAVPFEQAWFQVADKNGRVYRSQSRKGEAVDYRLVDQSGRILDDGTYRWELRLLLPRQPGEREPRLVLTSGAFQMSGGEAYALEERGAKATGRPQQATAAPSPRGGVLRAVEHHFAGDVGTINEMCVGCSSAFEPEAPPTGNNFGSEKFYVIEGPKDGFPNEGTPGIDFLTSEVAADADAEGWEMGVGFDEQFYIDEMGPNGVVGTTAVFTLERAPANTLYVSSAGNVGVRTSMPDSPLHVVGPSGEVALVEGGALAVRRTTSNPQIRFSLQDPGVPFQDWQFIIGNPNRVFAIRDETTGTTPLTFYPSAVSNSMVIRDGKVGIRQSVPAHPLHVGTNATNGNNAHVTAGGVWVNGSSRASKDRIRALGGEDAMATLAGLEPVSFVYKGDDPDSYLGFIAEDVPEAVATPDRKGVAAMDIVAVLTRVVQEQQEVISSLSRRVSELESRQAEPVASVGGTR